jgi:superfamily I DNA/RNA helicase
VLTYKIAYLVRAKQIPITRILAVTFTNKAANEMKERLQKITEDVNKIPEDKQKISENDKNDDIIDFLTSVTENQSSEII